MPDPRVMIASNALAVRLRADMRTTMQQYGVVPDDGGSTFTIWSVPDLVDDLVSDAMHTIEHLLDENDLLTDKLAAAQNTIARMRAGISDEGSDLV